MDTAIAMLRDLYDYHWWANRRLFEVATALGPEMSTRDMGRQWSFPTLKGLFAHIHGADRMWLANWQGRPGGGPLLGDADFPTMAALRAAWNPLEAEQRGFLDALTPDVLARTLEYKSVRGNALRAPLHALLQHVPNHATHHRSEIATVLTLLTGSPPDTGLHTFTLERTGQQR